MADEQDKKRTRLAGTPVLVVRCKTCKQTVAVASIVGTAEPLGQFLLDHREHDMALSRKRQKIGGGCTCPKATAEAIAACEE